MKNKINNIIKNHWRQMIDDKYFYRGMSWQTLNHTADIALDPQQSPLKHSIPLLLEYSNFLLGLINKGLKCQVQDFYTYPLEQILNWTIRDLNHPGIDFTTNYADATAYAFNYAGSQIKHNFNLITNTIHQCKHQPCFGAQEQRQCQEMAQQIKQLLTLDQEIAHQPIVIKVKRSCTAFQGCAAPALHYGSYKFFVAQLMQLYHQDDLLAADKIAFFLHQQAQIGNFNIRLTSSLSHKDIVEIIKF